MVTKVTVAPRENLLLHQLDAPISRTSRIVHVAAKRRERCDALGHHALRIDLQRSQRLDHRVGALLGEFEVGAGTHAMATPEALAAMSLTGGHADLAAAKKTVDEQVEHPPEAEQAENICPNMTNQAFAVLVMKLRDMAIEYIQHRRLPELERWDKAAQERVRSWFGATDQSLREYLLSGLTACIRVLQGLTPKNFVRYAEGGKQLTCAMGMLPASLPPSASLTRPHTPSRLPRSSAHSRTTGSTSQQVMSWTETPGY